MRRLQARVLHCGRLEDRLLLTGLASPTLAATPALVQSMARSGTSYDSTSHPTTTNPQTANGPSSYADGGDTMPNDATPSGHGSNTKENSEYKTNGSAQPSTPGANSGSAGAALLSAAGQTREPDPQIRALQALGSTVNAAPARGSQAVSGAAGQPETTSPRVNPRRDPEPGDVAKQEQANPHSSATAPMLPSPDASDMPLPLATVMQAAFRQTLESLSEGAVLIPGLSDQSMFDSWPMRTGQVVADLLPLDVQSIDKAVDAFFAFLRPESNGDPRRLSVYEWLATSASLIGIMEIARRRVQTAGRERDTASAAEDSVWAPYPVLALLPPEDVP